MVAWPLVILLFQLSNERQWPPSTVARKLVLAACRQWPFVKRQQPPGKELLDCTSIRYDARRGVLLDITLGTELSVFALRSMYSCKKIEVLHAENRRHVVALCGQVFVSDDRARKVLHFGPRELWEKDPELFLRFVREDAGDVPAPEAGGRGGLP